MGSMIMCATRAQWDNLRAQLTQEIVLEAGDAIPGPPPVTVWIFYILARNIGVVAFYQTKSAQEAQELRETHSAIKVGRIIPGS